MKGIYGITSIESVEIYDKSMSDESPLLLHEFSVRNEEYCSITNAENVEGNFVVTTCDSNGNGDIIHVSPSNKATIGSFKLGSLIRSMRYIGDSVIVLLVLDGV